MNEYDAWKAEQSLRWLGHIRSLIIRIAVLEAEIETQRTLALSASNAMGERVDSTPNPDTMADAVARIIELTDEYTASMYTLLDERADAHERLSRLEARYAQTLDLYYVCGLKWDEVAEKVHYEPKHCIRLRTEALPYVYDVMPREWQTMIPRAD